MRFDIWQRIAYIAADLRLQSKTFVLFTPLPSIRQMASRAADRSMGRGVVMRAWFNVPRCRDG